MKITVGTRWDSKGFVDYVVYVGNSPSYFTTIQPALRFAGEQAEIQQVSIKITEDCVAHLKQV